MKVNGHMKVVGNKGNLYKVKVLEYNESLNGKLTAESPIALFHVFARSENEAINNVANGLGELVRTEKIKFVLNVGT